jgi:hypothetical protein
VFPALVQLRTDETYPRQLKGLRAAAKITVFINSNPVTEAFGEVQFTEYGLSGIASMEVSRAVSAHFSEGDTGDCVAQLDLVPSLSLPELESFLADTAANHPDFEIGKLLFGLLPGRLSMVICKAAGLYSFSETAATLTGDNLRAVADCAKQFRLDIKGVQGFENAQVTAGGADVSEFNPLTLQSCKVNNLYCCGELLDVDGGCGGFNLQWAWSSGLLAGELGIINTTEGGTALCLTLFARCFIFNCGHVHYAWRHGILLLKRKVSGLSPYRWALRGRYAQRILCGTPAGCASVSCRIYLPTNRHLADGRVTDTRHCVHHFFRPFRPAR